jgi:hypothetical protein
MIGYFAYFLILYYTFSRWIHPLGDPWSFTYIGSMALFFAPLVVLVLLKPVRRFFMVQRKIVVFPHIASLIAVVVALLQGLDVGLYAALLLLVTPLILAAVRGQPQYVSLLGGFEDEAELKYYDKQALNVAQRYGGILTKVILVHEADMSLNIAAKTLQRLVDHGVAAEIMVYGGPIFDVPSSRAHLARLDREIIEYLLTQHGRAYQSQLLHALETPMEALERGVKRLVVYGIVTYDAVDQEIRLRNAPTTPPQA